MTSLRVLEDQLSAWAATNEAEGTLPELVRRLLLATAPLRSIEMRAGKATKVEGFDGRVIANRGGLYWPLGESVWELSVDAAPIKKLNRDYNKRVAELRAQGFSSVRWTYVAVTARISLKGDTSRKKSATRSSVGATEQKPKESWAEEKRRDKFFQDVWVLDATDLATWLSQAPVVEQWFLQTVLRQSTEYTSDLGRTLNDFSQRTRPPLPFEILLQGQARERAREQIYMFMGQKPKHLFVEGPSRDEAAHFVAAALSTMPNAMERDTWQNRTLMVWSADALLQMQPSAAQHDLTLIANFDDVPLDRLDKNVRIVIPVNPGQGKRDSLRLEDVPWVKFGEVLQEVGMREPDATRIAGESRGSLAALQHRLGYRERPRWVQDADMIHLAALVLVGAWQPDNPVSADRAIMHQLTGDADETERVCERLQRSPQRPMTKDTGRGFAAWTWTSRAHAWETLIDQIPATVLRKFEEIACEVLSTDDLIYTLPRDERLFEAARMSTPRASEALREGLAEGLARLGQADQDLREGHGALKGSELAAKVLRRIFGEHTTWSRWATLSPVLPHLAESSPQTFLSILKQQLVNPSDLGELFVEEQSTGFRPYAGLLHALEALAWAPERLGDCATSLAILHETDRKIEKKQRSFGDRPITSLAALFFPIRPQTNATPALCASELRRIVERAVPAIALDLVRAVVPPVRGVILRENRRPRFLQHQEQSDEDWQSRIDSEYRERVTDIRRIAVDLAGNDVKAWLRLLENADTDTDEFFLTALAERDDIADPTAELWSWLRTRLHGLARKEHAASGSESIKKILGKLYERFTPTNIITRRSWLFNARVELPNVGDWEECQRIAAEERENALREIWSNAELRESLLVQLVKAVPAPGVLGAALANSSFADEVEALLFARQVEFARCLPSFLFVRAGGHRDELLTRVRALVHVGQVDLALQVLYCEWPPDRALWDAIDEMGEPLAKRYWRELPQRFGQKHDRSTVVRVINKLLDAGNIDGAVEAYLTYEDELEGGELLHICERLVQDVTLHPVLRKISSRTGFVMGGNALEKLDSDMTLSPDRVAQLEIDLLWRAGDVGSMALPLHRLSNAFAKTPALFIELLSMIYRADGQSKRTVDETEREEHERKVLAVVRFLDEWAGYPGAGLSPKEANVVLENWARTALVAGRASGYGRVAPIEVAKVLARGPLNGDRIWPCMAARQLLEEQRDDELRYALEAAKLNARGGYRKSIGEGGIQERDIAARFRREADAVREEWPATARLLETIAEGYERDAQREDDRGATDRRTYGVDEVPPAASKAPQSETKKENPPPPKSVPPSQTRPDGPLTRLRLRDFGPAPTLDMKLAPRLNLLTGDNSLGKTFVLEVLWWVLTGSWAGHPAKPEVKRTKAGKVAKSKAMILANAGSRKLEGTYNALHERWSTLDVPSLAPGLVIYARVDGGFSVWDPIRNVVPMAKGELDLSAGYHFSPADLWQRLMADDGTTVLCRGLLDDLVSWKSDSERQDAYRLMETVLARISPENEPIKLGKPERFRIRDARDIPTLELPYGRVFVEHASAAVKRMLGFAYVLVWAVTEIRRAAPLAELDPLRHVTFLIDEVEAHLHPKWQRSIMSALLQLANDIAPSAKVQFVVTTHAPLVLVSIEQLVNDADDALFDFDLEPAENDAGTKQTVSVVEREPWEIHGDVNAWLASDIFDHTKLRSPEAERAMEKASLMLEESQPDKRKGKQVLAELVTTLGPKDPYLLRFRYLAEKKGWLS